VPSTPASPGAGIRRGTWLWRACPAAEKAEAAPANAAARRTGSPEVSTVKSRLLAEASEVQPGKGVELPKALVEKVRNTLPQGGRAGRAFEPGN